MLRTLLLGVLTVSAIASCKGKEGGPAVQAGMAAGKVVEISGTVTAKRGTESRTLASGNEVSGDDVIETGADSTISIVLAHNNATWSLGPNKREKVADSMAWALAKVDKPATGAVESTSAAGRHAEKSGANSGATVTERSRDESQPAPPAQPATATPAPGAAPDVTATPPAAPPPTVPRSEPKGTKPTKTAAPRDRKGDGGALGDLSGDLPSGLGMSGTGVGGGGTGGGAGNGTSTGLGGSGKRETAQLPAPAIAPAGTMQQSKDDDVAAAPKDKAAPAVPEIQVLANSQRDQMAKCLDTTMKSLDVTFIVEKGKARFKVPAGTAPAVSACLAKVAANMKPSEGLTANLALTIK